MLKLHLAGFTDKEEELVETLEDLVHKGVKENLCQKAAVILKLSPETVRSRLCRLRGKYRDCKRFCREYRSIQQRLYQRTGGKFHSL